MAIHNKSHFNQGLQTINRLNKKNVNIENKSEKIIDNVLIYQKTDDCLNLLKDIPDNSIDLIVLDPPYNLDLAIWDTYDDYIGWANKWINECYRILKNEGNLVIFGGIQYLENKSGDLIEILHYIRHNTKFRLVNTIVWYYKNGMSAHRYFANRHEELLWFTKSKKYYFDLDSVRVKYNEEELKEALKDKRLIPENVMKGKNPTNVWQIGRLNGNSLERVGHPTQKPLKIIRQIVKSMSAPGSIVLDFFAGSGTTGAVCIEEGRNCILCDKDPELINYFSKHIQNLKTKKKYTFVSSINEIFKD